MVSQRPSSVRSAAFRRTAFSTQLGERITPRANPRGVLAMHLLLMESMGEAVGEGLEEKGKHRPLARDDGDLDRHSRVEFHLRHPRQLISTHLDCCQEIGDARPRARRKHGIRAMTRRSGLGGCLRFWPTIARGKST